MPVVRENAAGKREMVLLRWGLVPGWSEGPDNRYSMINARAETVAQQPPTGNALRHQALPDPGRRFLHEWRAVADGKQPYVLRARPSAAGLAGLWGHWQDDQGNELESCAIIDACRQPPGETQCTIACRLVIAPQAFQALLDIKAQKSQPIRH